MKKERVIADTTTRPAKGKTGAKTLKPRKVSPPPFADKIPFITDLILNSVTKGVIKKIYLFGSYAYGKPKKSSDIDLCVLLKNTADDDKEYVKIARKLVNNNIMPFDLLIYQEKRFFDRIKKNNRGVESVISLQGKVLYG
jgi:predicted nucleotidyltransferase